MKTAKAIYLAALLAPVLFSCQITEQPVTDTLVPVSVKASLPPETRTSITGSSPEWTKGDQVAFITETELALCPPFTAGGSGASTTFSGQKPSGSRLRYALYPYDASASYSKSGIMTTLPSIQDGKFSSAIMVAEGNETDGFTFRSVCCLLKLNIPSTYNIVKAEVFSEEKISGGFGVYFSDNDLVVTASDPSRIADQRAVVASDNAAVISGIIYIAVLPTEAKKLSVAFTDASGKVATVSKALSSGNPLRSGTIKNLGSVLNLSFGTAAALSDPTYSQL